jgi:RHS repeat-associated protein
VANVWRSEFVYDAFGRRRIRREKVWKNSQWVVAAEVRYVYDGMLVIQEPPTPRGIGASTPGHVSVGWRCSGLSVAGYGGPRRDGNNVPTVSYTRGRDLGGGLQTAGGIGGLLALTQPSAFSPQHFYYHSDGNGNVTSLLDSHQTVAARYQYDPFGNLLASSGIMADINLYRFSSKEAHANSGLYYYDYRLYEPGLQRWINADPIEEDGGINLYGFVYNDPTDLLDLYGLDWWDDWQDWSEGASEAFYGSLAGLDPLGLVPIAPDNPNMQGGQYVGLAGGMCLGGTGEIKAGLAAAKALGKKALSKCKNAIQAAKHAVKRKAMKAAKARARIIGKGVPDPSGGTFRMGRFDPKTGQTVFDDAGYFGQDVKGLSLFEKDGKVFWSNDSISSPKILTADEVRAVESALREAFPNATIEQVKRITGALQ